MATTSDNQSAMGADMTFRQPTETIYDYLDRAKQEAQEQEADALNAGQKPSYPDWRPTPTRFTLLSWLPERLQSSLGFRKLVDYWSEAATEYAHVNTLVRLRTVMYPSTGAARLLTAGAAQIGHPYESELSDYAVSMLGQTRQLAAYREVAGTENWYKFVAFFFGAEIRCEYLYTDNYRQFYARPRGALLPQGGSWYKTTHVNLVVNIRQLRFNLKPRSSQSLYDRVLELFRQYIPVTLVIHNLSLLEQLATPVVRLRLSSAIRTSRTTRKVANIADPALYDEPLPANPS